MIMKKAALLVLCASLSIPMFGQETAQVAAQTAGADEAIGYYIRTIDFAITGHTRPFALLNALELTEGQLINGTAALTTLIRRKTQILRNERVLVDEECRIDYTIGEAGEDGLLPVDLLVQVTDAWNIIAIPEPKYDSNTGFSLTLKARDYNFLGTMHPLKFDFGWELEDNKNSVFADIDSDIPFTFRGYTWNFNFDNAFAINEADPNYYKNVTGLTMDIPWKHTTLTFGFDQSFFLNEENSDEEQAETGVKFFEDTWYMSSELYAKWKIPLGIEVGDFGEVTYNPSLTETFKYRPGGDIGEYRRGPATKLSHSIGFGQINWIGNFRNGLNVSVSNSNTFNNYTADWDNEVGISAEWHLAVTRFFGFSSRLKYTEYFNTTRNYSAGAELRGIRDKDLIADRMLSFNLELPLRIFDFTPSRWFDTRIFRPVDVEVHLSPFVDLALIDGVGSSENVDRFGVTYSFGDLFAAGGFEVIAFSLPWRSLYLRASLGWDLREWYNQGGPPGGSYREIYIGLGHYF